MEIREILDIGKVKILHEEKTKDGNTMTILAPFTQADEKNRNGRIYPKSLLKREVERVQKSVESGSFIGSADHHPSGQSTIADASHLIKKIWIDEGGKGWAELKIIPTPKGNSAMTLIKQGATLGLSTRGFGNVSPSGIVSNNYKLSGIDIVASPSASVAVFSKDNVFESVGFETKTEKKNVQKGSSEEFIQKIMESCYTRDFRESSFSGSFEDWKKKKEVFYRATIAVSDGKYETVEEALEAMGEPELAHKHSRKLQRVTPVQIAHEALAAGVSPQEYCDRINKSIDETEAAEATNYSDEERQKIYENARRAGVNVSTVEGRKEVLEKYDPHIVNDADSLLENEATMLFEKFKAERPDDNVTLESCRNLLLKERKIKEAEELKQMKIQSLVRETMLAGAIIRKKE